MYRRWMVGDVYAPHDLSGLEQSKWKRLRRRTKPKQDVFDQLGINPIHHYKVCLGGCCFSWRADALQSITALTVIFTERKHHV